jgi:hypothetical protein
MNRRRYQQLRRRVKAQPSDSGPRWGSAKALIKKVALGAVLGLCVTIAIGFGAFYLSTQKTTQPKSSGDAQIVLATTPSPVPVEKESRTSPTPTKPDIADSGTIAAEDPAHDRPPLSTPVPTAAPVSQPTAIVNDNRPREVKRSEAERKSVERERRQAERKRSRLEAMYRKHEISSEDYKKGQDEYKNEIAKYRSAVNGAEPTNE